MLIEARFAPQTVRRASSFRAASTAPNPSLITLTADGTTQDRTTEHLTVVDAIDGVPNLLCAFVGALVQVFLLRRAATLFNSHLLFMYLFKGVVSFLIAMSWLAGCGACAIGILWHFGASCRRHFGVFVLLTAARCASPVIRQAGAR